MKKLILSMLLLFGITVTAAAQAYNPVPMANTPATQLENNTMFYNPSQNIYYTEMYRSYWVWDMRSASWVKRVELVGTPTGTNQNPVYNSTYKSNNVRNTNTGEVKTKPPGQ